MRGGDCLEVREPFAYAADVMSDPQPIALDYYSPQNLQPPKPIRLIELAIEGIIYGGAKTLGSLGMFVGVGILMLITGNTPKWPDLPSICFWADSLVGLALGPWALITAMLCLRRNPAAFKIMVSFGWAALFVSIADTVFLQEMLHPGLPIATALFLDSWGSLAGIGWAAGFLIVILVVMYSPAVKRAFQPIDSRPSSRGE